MYRILALFCFIGLSLGRQPDAPHHSSDHLPNTAFSCRDKVLGGYYADPDAQCQMFHVCVKVAGVGIQDFRFLCPNGTAFDQEAQICAGWEDVACEPTALYYSSDNFDLYRIGSGFESKKAPHISEEEQDFHLQRAEPDLLSGAHSSNFFNNREGKDIDDPRPSIQNRNQVDQQQKRKVVKKIQRRPVEITTTPFTTTTQRFFTNNFAGSFVPTTSRPVASSTYVASPHAGQYNPTSDVQKNNYYEQTKQTFAIPKSTPAPLEVKKVEKVNYNDNRSLRQRPDNLQNQENDSNNYDRSRQQNRRVQVNRHHSDSNNNFSSTIKAAQPTERSQANRGRGQQTYQNIRTTQRPSSTQDIYSQQTQKQTSQSENYQSSYVNQQSQNRQTVQPNALQFNNQQAYNKPLAPTNNEQYNNQQVYNKPSVQINEQQYNNQQGANKHSTQVNNQQHNNQQTFNKLSTQASNQQFNAQQTFNQQSTQGNNQQYSSQQAFNKPSTPVVNTYRNENEQQTTYKIKYTTPSTTQSTPQNSQHYDNFKQFSQTYPENFDQHDKKATTKLNEKKQQYSAQTKTTATGFDNKNQGSSNVQHTPAPKFNTNLLYDNNQQSTPDYYISKSSQQPINKVSNQKPQYLSGQVISNQQERKSTTFEQQPTVQPFTYNPGKNIYHNQPTYDKSKLQQQYSTPKSISQQYEPRSSTFSYKNSEFDDGQYRPEFYEREAGGEYDITVRTNTNKRVHVERNEPSEQEFLKTAHSINIAASGNKLARENQRLNALSQTSPKQNYNVQSSTISSAKLNKNTQHQSYDTPKTTIKPSKSQINYDDQNNSYYTQSTTLAAYKPQNDVRANPQQTNPTSAPFNNQQYNARNTQQQNYYTASPNINNNGPTNQYFENNQNIKTFSQDGRQNKYDVTTQAPPKTQYTTASPRSVYSSFAAVTSEAPRPFSLRTDSPVVSPQPKKHIISKTSVSSPAKPTGSKKSVDVSYDYAYYDSDRSDHHYSEYENIEEFGRTSKKH